MANSFLNNSWPENEFAVIKFNTPECFDKKLKRKLCSASYELILFCTFLGTVWTLHNAHILHFEDVHKYCQLKKIYILTSSRFSIIIYSNKNIHNVQNIDIKMLYNDKDDWEEGKNAITKASCYGIQSIIILYFMTICAIKTFYYILQKIFIFNIHYEQEFCWWWIFYCVLTCLCDLKNSLKSWKYKFLYAW